MVRRQIGLGCVLRVNNFILGMGYFILGLSNFILDGVVRRQIGLGCVWQLDAICAALLHCGDGDTMCTNVSLPFSILSILFFNFVHIFTWLCPSLLHGGDGYTMCTRDSTLAPINYSYFFSIFT